MERVNCSEAPILAPSHVPESESGDRRILGRLQACDGKLSGTRTGRGDAVDS
jgi:hypothetical protein